MAKGKPKKEDLRRLRSLAKEAGLDEMQEMRLGQWVETEKRRGRWEEDDRDANGDVTIAALRRDLPEFLKQDKPWRARGGRRG